MVLYLSNNHCQKLSPVQNFDHSKGFKETRLNCNVTKIIPVKAAYSEMYCEVLYTKATVIKLVLHQTESLVNSEN